MVDKNLHLAIQNSVPGYWNAAKIVLLPVKISEADLAYSP